MRNDNTTPIQFLINNIQSFISNDEPNFAVLIQTGSLNPIHYGHLNNLNQTRLLLEQQYGFRIVGAYISPSHDQYVKCKLGEESHILGKHRIAMCKLAIQQQHFDSWLNVDSYECSESDFIDYPEVVQTLSSFLQDELVVKRKILSKPIQVIYVCGLDHFVKCGMISNLRRDHLGVAVVYRPIDGKKLEQWSQTIHSLEHAYFISPVHEQSNFDFSNQDVSSSQIREYIANNKPLEELTFSSVVQYMKQNHILFK